MTGANLSCRGITMRFGGVTAVQDVSLEFPVGKVMGVIGPNGSGKTTLFNVLSGELAPSAGEVIWEGRRISGKPPYRVASHGVVRTYQSATVFPELTVRESMEFAARTARRRGGRPVGEVAELTGLSPYMDETGRSLPYGHQKILGVALALLTAPRMLLLDEPAAGLNGAEVGRFLRLIQDIRQAHEVGIGIIDHDMGLIMPACDRIAVLNFGTLVAVGTPAEIRSNEAVLDIYLRGDLRGDAVH
jgi:ABC-type branched-subunit amino acid transport system ATPase component